MRFLLDTESTRHGHFFPAAGRRFGALSPVPPLPRSTVRAFPPFPVRVRPGPSVFVCAASGPHLATLLPLRPPLRSPLGTIRCEGGRTRIGANEHGRPASD